MRKIFIFAFIFCVGSLFAGINPQPFTKKPKPAKLSSWEEVTLNFYLEHLGPDGAAKSYRLGVFYLQTGNMQKAKDKLYESLDYDPNYVQTLLQLGFIHLWEHNYGTSYDYFQKALEVKPCNQLAFIGIENLLQVSNEEDVYEKIEKLEQNLDRCKSKDAKLYYRLAELMLRIGKVKSAKKALANSIRYDRTYDEPKELLSRIEGKKIPCPKDEKKIASFSRKQAESAFRKGNYQLANRLFCEILQKNPHDIHARRRVAQIHLIMKRYNKAAKQFALLREEGQMTQNDWLQSLQARSFTYPSFTQDIFYVQAKEDDPDKGAPVVKNYYFLERFTLKVPIFNQWRLEFRQIYYHQRENNIFNPSVNYTMYQGGASLLSNYYFAKNWRLYIFTRAFGAWGQKTGVTFPFQHTQRFEPGVSLIYNGPYYLFVADSHVESFVAKNIPKATSFVLRTDWVRGAFGLKYPDFRWEPEIEGWAGQIFYHDRLKNRQERYELWMRMKAPVFYKIIKGYYHFTYSHFKFLTPDYYTWKYQWKSVAGVTFFKSFFDQGKMEVTYEYSLQDSLKVLQTIGTFLFTTPRQKLIGKKVKAQIEYRFQDKMRFELGGHWFKDTLPYRDWKLWGALHAQF